MNTPITDAAKPIDPSAVIAHAGQLDNFAGAMVMVLEHITNDCNREPTAELIERCECVRTMAEHLKRELGELRDEVDVMGCRAYRAPNRPKRTKGKAVTR